MTRDNSLTGLPELDSEAWIGSCCHFRCDAEIKWEEKRLKQSAINLSREIQNECLPGENSFEELNLETQLKPTSE